MKKIQAIRTLLFQDSAVDLIVTIVLKFVAYEIFMFAGSGFRMLNGSKSRPSLTIR